MDRQRNIAAALGMTLTLMFGLISLPHPFGMDQALFRMGGEIWASGGVYYRDFWDIKPPGIYFFYAFAGTVFSFDEIGIHAFELIWSMTFAGLLLVSTRYRFRSVLAWAFVPVSTTAFYYVIADTWHLTQLEWLVCLPMFVCLVCVNPGTRGNLQNWPHFFAAGISAGCVAMFKPIYGLIPAGMWCVSVLFASQSAGKSIRTSIVKSGVAFSAGVLVPLLISACYFHWHGILGTALKTLFIFPTQILLRKTGGYGDLLRGWKWFAMVAGPLVAISIPESIRQFRRGTDAFSLNLVLWAILGLVLILAQRMWWEYHYLLLLPPLSLLGLQALDTLMMRSGDIEVCSRCVPERRLLFLGLCALFFQHPVQISLRTAALSKHNFATSEQNRRYYQSSQNPEYRYAQEAADFLSQSKARNGTIQVFGNPLIYRFSNRLPTIPEQTAAIKVYNSAQWFSMVTKLRQYEPVYIFIDRIKQHQLLKIDSGLVELLADQYEKIHEDQNGTWYELLRK